MRRDRVSQFRNLAAQFLLGGIGLVFLTFVCFRFGLNVATTGFAYLILIALLSMMGSFIGTGVLSIIAAGLLNYFFTEPLFSFRMDYPQDMLAVTAFLTTSIIVAGLTARVHTLVAQARASQKDLIETIPGLVWSAGSDGSRDFHSPRWLKLTGLSAEEAAGDGWTVVFHPEDRAGVVEAWRVAVASGKPFEVEGRERSANGDYRVMLVRAAPLRDERGTIVKWYGTSIDIEDSKRATEVLRDSEKQWREVFEHNPVMYFMIDAAGKVLSVNAFGASQLGYTVSELVGQSVLNVFFDVDREFVQKSIAVCLDNVGQSTSWDIRKIRKDGTVLWVRENAKAVRRAGNQLIVLIACEDITERKQAEDALRQSEMYLAEAQRISHTGSFGWRVDSGEMTWSDETFRIFGCDRTTKPTLALVLQLTHPEDRTLVQGTLERASRDGKNWEYERRLLLPDGSIKYVLTIAHAVKDASGELEFVGAVMDVTAAKQMEAALRESEGRFRDFAETASDWLWETDSEHRFTNVSEHEQHAAIGLAPASRIALTRWQQATDLELEPEKWQAHRALVSARQPFRDFVYQTTRGDGSPMYVKISGKPLFDAKGEFLGYRGTGSDVTAMVRADQAEAELREVQAELAHVARVTTIGELTAAIAHEVNQPLTGLVSSGNACLHWLAGEPPNLEAARRAIQRMIDDGARAGEVIGRIRALIKKSPPRKDWLNINDTIAEAVALVRGEVQRNSVALKTEFSNDLPLVHGDRIQLQQVILNLIMNAIEAISGSRQAQRDLLVASTKDDSNAVLVTVRDSGPGIDPTVRNRLFEAFFTTKSDGMGMGLAISRTIIEAHGGQLWATPDMPKGAEFQFRLPTYGGEVS